MNPSLRLHITSFLIAAFILTACAVPVTPATLIPTLQSTATFLPIDERPPATFPGEFTTDFTRHSVPYSEIISGGPPKDGIPGIDAPQFVSPASADEWLQPVEPVVILELNGDIRAYPLQILIWHELVNDRVGGVPVTVTFCPLCNTAAVFDRTVTGQVLDFGTTGQLRYSNLLMYDRQTESWWQQAVGEAIVGELTGSRLKPYPAAIISWQDFLTSYPQGQVLSRQTGFNRDYGRNPYVGYDDVNQSPYQYTSWLSSYHGPKTPDALSPMARLLTVAIAGDAVAYPYELLADENIVNDTVGGVDIVVLWAQGTASATNASQIAAGRDVGAAVAFARTLNDQVLSFYLSGGRILDQQTSTEWDILGQAVAGPLVGQRLSPVVALNHFWFSWAAFMPQTRIYSGAVP